MGVKLCLIVLFIGAISCSLNIGDVDVDVIDIRINNDNIVFVCKNTGDEPLSMIKVHYTAVCNDGTYNHYAMWGFEELYSLSLQPGYTKNIGHRDNVYMSGVISISIDSIEVMYNYDEHTIIRGDE